jgi:hypothetical protein
MQFNHFQAFARAILLVLLVGSCTRHNEEDLFGDLECLNEEIRYSTIITPIMQAHCNSCHSAPTPQANIITAEYVTLREIALDGRLMGVVKHLPGYPPMPLGMPRLDNCLILRLETWVQAGAPFD